MIYGKIAHTVPGDKKMMEAVNLKEESGVSCPDLKTTRLLYRDYCAVHGSVSHKMWSWYCDPNARWLIGFGITMIEGERSGLLGFTCSLPVFVDSLASCCKILWHPLLSFYVGLGSPPPPLKDLKGTNVTLQGVLRSQELYTYLILFKTQTETLQETFQNYLKLDFLRELALCRRCC